jgi:manganese/zinc/iron transport system permease protein
MSGVRDARSDSTSAIASSSDIMQELWREWIDLDTWIVVTAALAAIACALPGNYLLLRRQSLLGDALSHAVLPGIVAGYLAWNLFESAGWFPVSQTADLRHFVLFAGAACSGLLAVLTTEWMQRLGRLEAGSALGVVFTAFFALGLLLIRLAADQAHIDPGCVLYGNLETISLDRLPGTAIPRAAVVNGAMALLNAALWIVFYKELQLAAFDPGLAETLGIPVQRLHYGAAAITAATVVAAFETVGSILVIAMLIVPAATARLLTDRLRPMIFVSVATAALSAILGHVGALTLPRAIFSLAGYPEVEGAGTAGMTALASGLLFVLALVCGPKHGLLRRAWDKGWWQIRIATDDVLGALYRQEESSSTPHAFAGPVNVLSLHPWWIVRLAMRRLILDKSVVASDKGHQLTDAGRHRARELVRSHRLWEAWLSQQFHVPGERVHASAEKVEHFLGETLREGLAAELQQTTQDPHGRVIPPEHEPESSRADSKT